MVSDTQRSRLYAAGKKEQLEHDVAMIQDVLDKSYNIDEFRQRLAEQLSNLDMELLSR